MEDPGSSPTAGCDAGQTQLTTTICAVERQEVDGQCDNYYYDDYYIILITIIFIMASVVWATNSS